jgi:hypothetical protein
MRVWILAAVLALVQPALLRAEGSSIDPSSTDDRLATENDLVAQWIAELESDQYLVRENATNKLRDAGPAAFDTLLGAANGQHLEAADRSVWLLEEFGQSEDRVVAMAALARLAQLKYHAAERWQATMKLAELAEQYCSETLTRAGAQVEMAARIIQYDRDPERRVQLKVTLPDAWVASDKAVEAIVRLNHCELLRLVGAPVTDQFVEQVRTLPNLQRLELFDSRVTPEAVVRAKAARPELAIHLRNASMLGIGGEPVSGGIRILEVRPGTAAAQADLREGDVIAKYNGHPQEHFDTLTAYIAQDEPGEEVQLEIVRGGETLMKTVRLGAWPETERL